MGKYLDLLQSREAQSTYDQNDINDKSYPTGCGRGEEDNRQYTFGRINRFGRMLEDLERRCPDHVELELWRQALEGGRTFLARWGERAEALGWTARDLFGLHPVPNNHGPSYRRLARYNATGLIWLLRGRHVVGLSEYMAEIEGNAGAVTRYYRQRNSAKAERERA